MKISWRLIGSGLLIFSTFLGTQSKIDGNVLVSLEVRDMNGQSFVSNDKIRIPLSLAKKDRYQVKTGGLASPRLRSFLVTQTFFGTCVANVNGSLYERVNTTAYLSTYRRETTDSTGLHFNPYVVLNVSAAKVANVNCPSSGGISGFHPSEGTLILEVTGTDITGSTGTVGHTSTSFHFF